MRAILALLVSFFWSGPGYPAGLPQGLYFVGLDGSGEWHVVLVGAGGVSETIPTDVEPRTVAIDRARTRIAYVGADGSLRVRDLGRRAEYVLLTANRQVAYAQPIFSTDGTHLYFVAMKEGKSLETELMRIRLEDGKQDRAANQPGAQFEPYVWNANWLVYSNVSCSEGCPSVLQEIWVKNLIGEGTRQATLLNAVSREPVTDGRTIVFTSNVDGRYRLWQIGLDGSGLRKLTDGDANDLSPVLLADGRVIFVRQSRGDSRLVQRNIDGSTRDVTPAGVRAIRSLRAIQ